MSVYSASETSHPFRRNSSTARGRPTDAARSRRRATGARPNRRLAAASARAMHRLAQHLGPSWQVLETPLADPVTTGDDHAGFVTIGPGGVFAITVVDQGRQRIMVAGDVVQIRGARPPHVARARRYAKTVRAALSAAVGATVPVVPVLTFVGSGAMSTHGLPVGCLVVNHRELDRLLRSIGEKIRPETARKLAEVAGHPATWGQR